MYFTSDLHLDHARISQYCGRPFHTVEQMNDTLIKNWNRVVSPKDEIYVLGDFCMGSLPSALNHLRRLNGRKYLVAGNHDQKLLKHDEFRAQWEWVKDYHEHRWTDAEGTKMIVMSHYPFMSWNGMHRMSWMCHGHCHSSLPDSRPWSTKGKILDVGVDANNYTPLSLEVVEGIMKKKTFKAVDHHVSKEHE